VRSGARGVQHRNRPGGPLHRFSFPVEMVLLTVSKAVDLYPTTAYLPNYLVRSTTYRRDCRKIGTDRGRGRPGARLVHKTRTTFFLSTTNRHWYFRWLYLFISLHAQVEEKIKRIRKGERLGGWQNKVLEAINQSTIYSVPRYLPVCTRQMLYYHPLLLCSPPVRYKLCVYVWVYVCVCVWCVCGVCVCMCGCGLRAGPALRQPAPS
jgi:hypothetical protein